MSFKDALAKARAERPEPSLVEVALGDDIYLVEVMRLDGMDWAAIMAECPPTDAASIRMGVDLTAASMLACKRYSTLRDTDGDVVEDCDWDELFSAASGPDVRDLSAVWWALNMRDPNRRVAELKKALAAGERTSSS